MVEERGARNERRDRMYIGGGFIALILIILLLIWLF
jgi:flagellar biogenesis protein FliO